jgi:hypothetical protein
MFASLLLVVSLSGKKAGALWTPAGRRQIEKDVSPAGIVNQGLEYAPKCRK